MEVTAREATDADLDDLDDLAAMAIAELTPHRGGELWRRESARPVPPRDSLADDLADPAVHVVVGTIDDVPVGYAAVGRGALDDGSYLARVSDLYTRPEARAVGVGESMMNALVDWSREQGCFGIDSLALPGDRHTKNFFESFGLVARAIVVHRSLEP